MALFGEVITFVFFGIWRSCISLIDGVVWGSNYPSFPLIFGVPVFFDQLLALFWKVVIYKSYFK